jgi:aspartate kinase
MMSGSTDMDGVASDPPYHRTHHPQLTYGRSPSQPSRAKCCTKRPPGYRCRDRLRICNTFNPDHPGTAWWRSRRSANGDVMVTAIQAAADHHRGQHARGSGVTARTLAQPHRHSVPLITQAVDDDLLAVRPAPRMSAALESAFSNELAQQDIDRIWATEEVVIITVVGAGMIHTPGIAGRVFTSLGSQNVNVIAIAQGSSEVSISLVVSASDADASVRALHDLILARRSS